MAIDPAADPAATAWTYGMRLCVRGTNPVELVSVKPHLAVGGGETFLGALVRTFTPTPANQGIISIAGYPPESSDVPDPTHPVAGYVVMESCANEPGQRHSELLIGLGRTGPGGGGWRGVDVTYLAGGQERTLMIRFDMLICGPAIVELCRAAPPGGAPGVDLFGLEDGGLGSR